MKRFLISGMILLTALLAGAQTAVPNGNFEQWTGNKPTGWDATNFQFGIIPIQTVFRDTVLPVSGASNALIKTRYFNLGIAQPTIPGIITLGKININLTTFSGSVDGGIPFTGTPLSIKGYINAQPVPGDSAMIAVGFSKWNGVKRDTIGYALVFFSTPHNEWVTFDIPITYFNAQQPDSMNIIISSSAVGNEVFVDGSQLRVDTVLFDYGNVLIEENFADMQFRVWADPYRNLFYSYSCGTDMPVRLVIYNMSGLEVKSIDLDRHDTKGRIGIYDMVSGVYIVGLVTAGHRMYTRRFVVK